MAGTVGMEWEVQGRFSDIRTGGLIEAICPHGIGHHKGVHGCDGCCADAPPEIWEQVTDETV